MVYRPAASHYLTAMGVDDLVEVALAVDDAEAEEDRKDLPGVDRDAAEAAAQKASQPSRAAGRTPQGGNAAFYRVPGELLFGAGLSAR
jgi:hypothetical protein